LFREDRSVISIEVVYNGAADGDAARNTISIIGGLSSNSEPALAAATYEDSSLFFGHCFIATALYVDNDQKKLALLREFRDQVLLPTSHGESFVRSYYRYSPPIANWLRDNNWAQASLRVAMLPVIGIAWIILHATVLPMSISV